MVTSREIKKFFERGRAFEELIAQMNWPPPWHLPTIVVDALTAAHAKGQVTPEAIGRVFAQLYDGDLLLELLAEWRSNPWLSSRSPILEEGISNHTERRYFSSVCTLLPQVEGIIGDYLGRDPNAQNDAGRIFADTTRLGDIAKNFYVRLAREAYTWGPEPTIPVLARNAILHGRATSFGTREESLKVILVLDAVIGAIKERRADQP